ncbi:hypothetical protein ACGFNU_09470 [Spirillospora sp. NPDC048911]|uniref:hypothetical protein n=1 Tax=Spirillospora sp. NPDC048911 TaxID=3364527 RepID=UPI0037241B15
MSTDHWDLDRAAAERLLRGEPGDSGTPAEPLGRVLAAASAPARGPELAGEESAVAAFTAAAAAPLPKKRGRGLPLTRILTAKIAALSLAVTAAGGVALAAGTGALPMGPLDGDPDTTVSPGRPVSKSPSAEPSGGQTSPRPTHGANQPSALSGLCRSYASGDSAHRAEALRSAAYVPLVSAAGGAHKVPGYCSKLLKKDEGKGTTKNPKKAKTPKEKPSKGNNGSGNGNQGNNKNKDKDDDGNGNGNGNGGNGNGGNGKGGNGNGNGKDGKFRAPNNDGGKGPGDNDRQRDPQPGSGLASS